MKVMSSIRRVGGSVSNNLALDVIFNNEIILLRMSDILVDDVSFSQGTRGRCDF